MISVTRTQLTGRSPKERIKELILDEHTQCGCSCNPFLRRKCGGRYSVYQKLIFKYSVLNKTKIKTLVVGIMRRHVSVSVLTCFTERRDCCVRRHVTLTGTGTRARVGTGR